MKDEEGVGEFCCVEGNVRYAQDMCRTVIQPPLRHYMGKFFDLLLDPAASNRDIMWAIYGVHGAAKDLGRRKPWA